MYLSNTKTIIFHLFHVHLLTSEFINKAFTENKTYNIFLKYNWNSAAETVRAPGV